MTRHGWKENHIGNIAKVKGGKRLPKGSLVQDERTIHPYLRVVDFKENGLDETNIKYVPDNIQGKIKRYVITSDDIYISIAGTIGRVGIIPKRLSGANLTENAAKICEIDKSIDKRFFLYFLRSQEGQNQIQARVVGTSQPKLALYRIEEISFKSPSLLQQQKISLLLSNYDDLIEKNSRRIQLLESMAKLIYDEWFVKFKFPGHETVKMVPSELGEIPEGWRIAYLSDVADIRVGYPFKAKCFCEDTTLKPIVRIRDILNNFTDTFSDEKVDIKYEIHPGDMLIGMDGIFHICIWSNKVAYLNQRVALLRPINNISKYFLLLSVKPKIERLNDVIVGTTVQHLSQRDFDKMKILMPPSDLLTSFKSCVDKVYNNEILLRQKNLNLAATRDMLLPKLISGAIDVSKLDIKVPEAEV